MTKIENDPIEGFQITGYDEKTQTLTIAIHPSILAQKNQESAIALKAVEIIGAGPNVDKVEFVPRDKT